MVADPMNLICGNTSEGMQRQSRYFTQIHAATLPIGSGLRRFLLLLHGLAEV